MVPVRRLPESNHWLLGILYLLITCLPCNSAQGQQPSSAARPLRDKFYTRRPEFDVPFQVDSRSSDLVEVQLMASIDRGRQWQPVSRGAPTDRALHFRA
ncbi:MAG: hypothetical protein ACKOUR_08130, partial [Planctomycetota bacterium]